MRAVIQRTGHCNVTIDNQVYSQIGFGLTVLLGIDQSDTHKDAEYLSSKILNLRIFTDDNDKMNLSLLDIKGELMVISQFTLQGDCRKGRRPSFEAAARPKAAEALYEYFVACCQQQNIIVQTGKFQAEMAVTLQNIGPVTILLDSNKQF